MSAWANIPSPALGASKEKKEKKRFKTPTTKMTSQQDLIYAKMRI